MQSLSFKEVQLQHERVKLAYDEKETTIKSYFAYKQLPYEHFQMFIRAFKKEELLEVWVRPANSPTYSLLQTYRFCASSGVLGPKRKEGDLQIPEGIYHINHFNPKSNFHLSLGINYPNASDKILSDKNEPGSAIYIHGNCLTIGCIPITDEKIKELYILAVEAHNNGQQKIPVHIFPWKFDDASLTTHTRNKHSAFWQNLNLIYKSFEEDKKLPRVGVDNSGRYVLK